MEDASLQNQAGRTAPKFEEAGRQLCSLAYNGELEQLKLLAKSSNCNAKCRGFTPLMRAAAAPKNSGLDCMRYLLQLGADVMETDGARLTAMHLAAMNNNTKIMRLLSQFPQLLDCQTELLETPLMLAASYNSASAVKLLLAWGVDICKRDREGKTAADRACDNDSWAAYIAICNSVRHSRTSDLTEEKKTRMVKIERSARRLCQAAAAGDFRLLRKLATPQNCNRRWRGHTPLMRAALSSHSGSADCALHLLSVGASLSTSDASGWTVAHYAAYVGNVELLHRLPYDTIDQPDSGGYTPLMLAADAGKFSCVQLLIARQVNLHSVGKDGYTAAMAAESGGYESVKKLLSSAVR